MNGAGSARRAVQSYCITTFSAFISDHRTDTRSGDVYRGGRFLLMFCWLKSDTTVAPSISKSSRAFSVYC